MIIPMISVDLESSTSIGTSKNSSNREKVMEIADLDKALTVTGYGRFHYEIMACCAFCLLATGLQNGLAAYVLPAAHCELNLSTSQMGFVNAAFLIGGTCSSFLWGVVADLTGRKKVLAATLLVDVIVTSCCSLMQNFTGLAICRFLSGFLIGAPGSLTFTYMAEFHAPRHRSKSIYYSGVFYTLSWLFLPIIAWLVLPHQFEVRSGDFMLCSPWRVFLLMMALPELIAGLWISYLPESPKFLATGDSKKALMVLKEMYALNTGNDKNEFPVKSLTNDVTIVNCAINDNINCRGKIARLIESICFQLKSLFSTPFVVFTVLISGIMFCNMFGYFGLGLWLPEFLTRFDNENHNATTDSHTLGNNSAEMIPDSISCLPEFNSLLFVSTIVMGISCLVGNVLSGLFANRFNRNVIPFVTMFAGGISAGSFYWLNTFLENFIAACIFQSTISTANIVIGGVIVDLFPTSMNAMAVCTAMFSGRIGAIFSNVLFGFLMDSHSEIAILVVTGVLLLGAFLSLIIPNDINKNTNRSDKGNIDLSVISATSM